MTLLEKARTFPRKPGVYIFKDKEGSVIYVGKAKALKSRVMSYFHPSSDKREQIAFLLKHIKDIEFIVTDSEKEALLLENTLIKRYKPRYNLSLKDDKNYISISLNTAHDFPGIALTRKIGKDNSEIFGPFGSAVAAREAVDQITKHFNIRACTDGEFANRVRTCLKYDIGRCSGPCVGKVTKREYGEQVDETILFLSGRSRELVKRLKGRMLIASGEERYEVAAKLRDAISMIESVVERQKVVQHGGGDHDAIGLTRDNGRVAICILRIRSGLLIGKHILFSSHSSGDDGKLIEEFLLHTYRDTADIPSRILLPYQPEGMAVISQILSDRSGAKVTLAVPKRGAQKGLVDLSNANASEAMRLKKSGKGDDKILEKLGRRSGINGPLDLIECVDISSLSGREAVGSIVCFEHGMPDKSNYRIYNIRTLSTPDDYGMLCEVLGRRFANLDRRLPNLLLIDGGKGQLAVAVKVMRELSLDIPIAAIAKPRDADDIDRVFVPGRKNPLNLKKDSKELLFLMRIRDEAHRFGIGAHRRRRVKNALSKRFL